MNSKEFKNLFNTTAQANDFKKAFGSWYKESEECIVILELQKSSFADSYYLNIKIFIQGAFERTYLPNKELTKSSMGHITKQIRDKDVLDFTEPIDYEERKADLIKLFNEFIVPFTNKSLSRSGINDLVDQKAITLLPAVKEELKA